MSSPSILVFEQYIKHHEIEIRKVPGGYSEFCHGECDECNACTFCTGLLGLGTPTLTEGEFCQIKKAHPEYFI